VAHRRTGLTPASGIPGTVPPTGTRRWGARRWRRVAAVVACCLVLLLAASVAGLLPMQMMRVSSGSMDPTIAVGDLVVLERSASPVRRMDVVVVEDPEGDGFLVKRAVALGGDTVGLEDGVLVVNGTSVCETAVDQSRVDGVYFGPVTVPVDDVFLLGDERGDSIDSRDFGPLPDSDVVGHVRVRLWPSPGSLPSDRC
jgi:signal peptidase I